MTLKSVRVDLVFKDNGQTDNSLMIGVSNALYAYLDGIEDVVILDVITIEEE